MNRIFISLLVFCMVVLTATPGIAKKHKLRERGVVTSVNEKEQNFTIKNKQGNEVMFKVTAKSDFEIEHHDSYDSDVSFQELKVGDNVKVKAYKGDPPLADDVEIYR